MESDVVVSRKTYQEKVEECEVLRARVEQLEKEKADLAQREQYLLKRLYGRKAEAFDPDQLWLELGQIAPPPEEDAPVVLPPVEPRSRRPRLHKPRLPENLPIEKIELVPAEVEADPEAFTRIGEEVTEELGMVPPRYFRRHFIRGKYVSKINREQPPIIAPLPKRLIPGSYASPELLTDLSVKKYVEHQPLYRQEQSLKLQYGIEVSRKTMCDWLGQVAWWLKAIYNHLRDDVRSGGYMQIDETPIQYCGARGQPGGKGYLWVFLHPERGVVYEWHTSRAADCLKGMLDTFSGVVQCDGYQGYTSYAKNRDDIQLVACWAHVRRKFYEAMDECPQLSGWILGQIGHLYRVESELRRKNAGPKLRQAARASQSRMIAERLVNVLRIKLPAHRPRSQMGKALSYALSQWDGLTPYLDKGAIKIDNNLVENAIRPTALGKKNWLFFGAPQAGERAAIIYTLLEQCKRLGINPRAYLQDVLTRLPQLSDIRDAVELTPAAWQDKGPQAKP